MLVRTRDKERERGGGLVVGGQVELVYDIERDIK